jgi:hypothetical protein
MTSTHTPVKNASLTADHLGSKVLVDGGPWLIQGELHSVSHGATPHSNGIPMVSITIKISQSIPVPYDQAVTVVLHTEAYPVTILATEDEWKGR